MLGKIKKTYKEIYGEINEIAEHYGYYPQSRQLIEEMAELTVAINKEWRLMNEDSDDGEIKDARMHIAEEMADVQIMILQISHLLQCRAHMNEIMVEKLDRQISRIREKEEHVHKRG